MMSTMSIVHTLKFRLIALCVLLVTCAALLRLVATVPFAKQLLVDMVSSQQLSIATYVARDIDHSIVERRVLITTLAATLPQDLIVQAPKLNAWIAERQRLNPLFDDALMVLRPDGKSMFGQSPDWPARRTLDYSHFDWFQAALRSDEAVIGKPLRGRLTGEPLLMMAKAVRGADRRVRAVIIGISTLNAPGFLHRLQERHLGTNGGFLLVSPADKLFVGATDPAMILKATPPAGINRLHDRAMAGYRGSGVTTNYTGEVELSSMASVPSTGWFVAARLPELEIFQPIKAMRDFILKSAALSLLGLGTCLLLILVSVLRPLTSAARAMREMADGQRALAPLPVVRRDEVGDLVSGFNYLVERLNEKEAALKASELKLSYMAHHDALTGLCNRFMLEDRLGQALARAQRDGSHFAVLFCDLDDFKPINDRFGHETGDLILREVAQRLLAGRRQTDTVARFGGDEFVVLLTDLKSSGETALHVAAQLRAAVGTPFEVAGQTFTLSVSVGVAQPNDSAVSVSQILSQADIAMYNAKRGGKNRILAFDPAMACGASAPCGSPAA